MLGGSMPRDGNSKAVWWFQVNYKQKMFYFSPSLFRIGHLELISTNSLAVASELKSAAWSFDPQHL